MSHYDKKRHTDYSQTLEPTHKRQRTWNNGAAEQPVKSANDRIASSIYKGRTLINKTPQKIVFNDDPPQSESKENELTSARLARKKSVTFTPETKNEDGATGQTFTKMWLSPAAPGSADPATVQDSTPTKATAKALDSVHDKSKSQAKKKPSKKKLPSDSDTRTACLAYLDLFHNDHPNWKFNKARQNDLLRHLFNLESLPASYNPAILSYMKGFTGAAASQRLADEIVEILDPILEKHKDNLDNVSISTPASRRDAYQKAVEQQHRLLHETEESNTNEENLKVVRLETEQAERANALMEPALWKLLRSAPIEEASAAKEHVATESAAPAETPSAVAVAPEMAPAAEKSTVSKRRSRKSRTATYSSSESSSSSDDSDDSD